MSIITTLAIKKIFFTRYTFLWLHRERLKYDAGFKVKVVKFAKKNNNCAADGEFGVNEKLDRDWRKQELNLHQLPKTKCTNSGGSM